jgi:hypothetical protein
MKRFGILAAGVLSAVIVAGCGGGIEEGPPPTGGAMDAQPADFKANQKQFAGKMQMQKRPAKNKTAPATDPTTETKGEP